MSLRLVPDTALRLHLISQNEVKTLWCGQEPDFYYFSQNSCSPISQIEHVTRFILTGLKGGCGRPHDNTMPKYWG